MMKPAMDSTKNTRSLNTFGPVTGPLSVLQANSCSQSIKHSLAHHPLIRKRKSHQPLDGVLGKAPVGRLAMPKRTLDHPKRVFHLGWVTGLDLLNPIGQSVAGLGFVQRQSLAQHHGNLPVHNRVFVLNLLALFNAPVARVGRDHCCLPMQQGMRLHHIVCIGRRCRDRVRQPRVCVHANEGHDAKVPLFALLGVRHSRVALVFDVLGGAGRRNQGGIHHRAGLEHQLAINQLGIDSDQNLRAPVVLFAGAERAGWCSSKATGWCLGRDEQTTGKAGGRARHLHGRFGIREAPPNG
jgi:hypothetical protein